MTPAPSLIAAPQISERDFRRIRDWIYGHAGIHLSDQKKALVCGRLAARVRHFRLGGYGEYFDLLRSGAHPGELQTAVDLLTTNETYFFREPKHFDFLRGHVVPRHRAGAPLRIWSAACSSGEEPYSIGITLADCLGERPWEILASDLSQRMLERARAAVYPAQRAKHLPRPLMMTHCLKGIGTHEGCFQVAAHITSRVRFSQINLNESLPAIGVFDVIFLRNVMIYFNGPTKQQVIDRILPCLKSGGYLMTGHSESLTTVSTALKLIAPAIYCKP